MTLIWLFVWLCYDTPEVHMWNNWAIGLAVCIALDIMESKSLL